MMTNPTNDIQIKLLKSGDRSAYQSTMIAGRCYIAACEGEEFIIEVICNNFEQYKRKCKYSEKIIASVKIDGDSLGYCQPVCLIRGNGIIREAYTSFNYTLSNKGMQALQFYPPDLKPFRDEYEAKSNISLNKLSPVGTIVVELWTSISETKISYPSGNSPSKKTVADTKKFFDRPSVGTTHGRFLGNKVFTIVYNRINCVGSAKILYHNPIVIKVLKSKSLANGTTVAEDFDNSDDEGGAVEIVHQSTSTPITPKESKPMSCIDLSNYDAESNDSSEEDEEEVDCLHLKKKAKTQKLIDITGKEIKIENIKLGTSATASSSSR